MKNVGLSLTLPCGEREALALFCSGLMVTEVLSVFFECIEGSQS